MATAIRTRRCPLGRGWFMLIESQSSRIGRLESARRGRDQPDCGIDRLDNEERVTRQTAPSHFSAFPRPSPVILPFQSRRASQQAARSRFRPHGPPSRSAVTRIARRRLPRASLPRSLSRLRPCSELKASCSGPRLLQLDGTKLMLRPMFRLHQLASVCTSCSAKRVACGSKWRGFGSALAATEESRGHIRWTRIIPRCSE